MSPIIPNIKTEEEICELLKKSSTSDDFFRVQCLISNLFFGKSFSEINNLINYNNFYINAYTNVIKNESFIEALRRVTEQFQNFKKNYNGNDLFEDFKAIEIKNKKTIFNALIASTSFLSNVFPNLNQENIIFLTKWFKIPPNRFVEIFKYKYSPSEIYYALSSVFDTRHTRLDFPFKINDIRNLFLQQRISREISFLIFTSSFRGVPLNALFRSIERDKMRDKFSSSSMYRISSFIRHMRQAQQYSIQKLREAYGENTFIETFVQNLYTDKNEGIAFELIELTVSRLKTRQNMTDDLLNMMDVAEVIRKEINAYASRRFKVFSEIVTDEKSAEWSNKVYINCNRLLGALNGISGATDKKWKVDACVNEFSNWMGSIHLVLNKYDIVDDWVKIAKYLDQENNKIEWKSSFFTPTESKKDSEDYSSVSKKIFYGIIKTLLGMINTEGGTILIGLVEKPEEIIEEEIRNNIIEKNKNVFFDVSFELSSNKTDMDGIKRKIQDSLKKETLISIESFNNLWNIQPIIIRDLNSNKEITIYKIDVSKSDKLIYSCKVENEPEDLSPSLTKSENVWISLLKRADARTVRVDPRNYLTNRML